MAIGVGVVVLALLVGVVYAATRGGGDEAAPVEPFATTIQPTEQLDTDIGEPTVPASDVDAEDELYSHIPSDVQSYSCEQDSQTPATAGAGVICELGDQDLIAQYWLFDDAEAMYDSYDERLAGNEQVVDGDCPDESPSQTSWVDGDGVTQGRYACYVIFLTEGDDAHVIWTHDDLLILSLLSHISVNRDTSTLMDFWATSAGPE